MKVKEYRIEERDVVATPRLTIPNGTKVEFRVIVSRIGYEFDSTQIPPEDWHECGKQIIAEKAEVEMKTAGRVIDAMNLKSPYAGIRSEIYSRLVAPRIEQGSQRCMFFCTLDRAYQGVIVKRKRRTTGVYHRKDGKGELRDAKNQSLYLVRVEKLAAEFLVHPDDIRETKK